MPNEGRKPIAGSHARTRDVVITGQFKRDVKRLQKGPHQDTLRVHLQRVVDQLANDIPLPPHMVDHPLGGEWKDHRDCHIRPDLILIYRKSAAPKARPPRQPDAPKLHLVRLGSHSELGL